MYDNISDNGYHIREMKRDDMLELTRRMTLSRNCFHRIAGAYFDSDGYVDGTFNTHFLKLSKPEQKSKLEVARAIPFAKTNVELREYRFLPDAGKQGSVWQFLKAILDSEMKNDAMLETFYEMFGEQYQSDRDYGIYFFLGNYDIPRKGADKANQWESEEVYRFLICAVCPVDSHYEPEAPECGFLFPAYRERGAAEDYIDVYQGIKHPEFLKLIGVD